MLCKPSQLRYRRAPGPNRGGISTVLPTGAVEIRPIVCSSPYGPRCPIRRPGNPIAPRRSDSRRADSARKNKTVLTASPASRQERAATAVATCRR